MLNIFERVRVMVFNATFNNLSAISCGQFYWWKNLDYPENPPPFLFFARDIVFL